MHDEPKIVKTADGQYNPVFDDNVNATFFNQPVYLEFDSKAKGEEIYEDRPHIKLEYPGNRLTTLIRPVKMEGDGFGPSDPVRFPREWEMFTKGSSNLRGTLISSWPGAGDGDARQLAAANIMTVEQLAAVPDAHIAGLGLGGRLLRNKAEAWLALNAAAPDPQAVAKDAARDAEIANLREMVDTLLAQQAAPEPKRRAA